MSRWLPERRRSRAAWGVDARSVAWHGADAVAVEEAGREEGALRAAAALPRGRTVDVIASSELAVHWLQHPPEGARTLAELRLAAAARCAHLFGGTAASWWVAGDWDTRRPFVCGAVPLTVVEPLRRAAQEQGLRLRWHTAWSVLACAHARGIPDEGWSAWRTPSRVLLWHCAHGVVDAISSLVVTADTPGADVDDQLQMHMRLERAHSGATAEAPLHWVDAAAGGTEALAALKLAPLLEGIA